MFRFSNHPAAITITGGIKDAWDYMVATWQRWVVVVVVVSAIDALISLTISSSLSDVLYYDQLDRTYHLTANAGDKAGTILLAFLLSMAVTFLVACYFYGLAISGLRGRPLALGWIVERGIVNVASGLLVALGFGAALIAIVIVTVATLGLGALLLVAFVPVAIYVFVRLALSGIAIFDGAGPIEGLRTSWGLTRLAALRTFGWLLMGVLISLLFSIGAAIVSIPFASAGINAATQLISSVAASLATLMTTLMLAILYESQRARWNPNLYPMPATPYPPPWGQYPGAYPPGAYPPGAYPPGAYPPGAYPPGAYPPGAYPPGAYPPGAGAYPPAPTYPPIPGPPPGAYPPVPGYPGTSSPEQPTAGGSADAENHEEP
jgi:hypothetical protein